MLASFLAPSFVLSHYLTNIHDDLKKISHLKFYACLNALIFNAILLNQIIDSLIWTPRRHAVKIVLELILASLILEMIPTISLVEEVKVLKIV